MAKESFCEVSILISELFKTLKDIDKESLQYAFDNDLEHIIFFRDNTFLGVNINENNPEYEVTESSNRWYYGRINAKSND